MTLAPGHSKVTREFKTRPQKRTGSAGKPQSQWPWVVLVGAESVCTLAAGSQERLVDERSFPYGEDEFKRRMEELFPGVWAYLKETMPGRSTPQSRLLKNRVYKMVYNGTSARGLKHDPRTRAAVSREHWRSRVPLGHPLYQLAEGIRTGRVTSVPDWKKYLWEKKRVAVTE